MLLKKNAVTLLLALFVLGYSTQMEIVVAQPNLNGAAADKQQVVIKREALNLISPKKYEVSLHLEPSVHIELVAPEDGSIQLMGRKTGEKVRSQTEMLRLDAARATLVLAGAKANFEAAKVQLKIAEKSSDKLAVELATAKLEAAKAEMDVAQYDVDQLVVRAPIDGIVFRTFVSAGQPVKAGQKLATVGTVEKLIVEIPVERKTTKVDSEIDLKVEDTVVKAKVISIQPLPKEFEHIRELMESAAMAQVEIDNSQDQLKPGQAVHPSVVPTHPITEIPNATLSNNESGERKVQVVRENVVRDIVVKLHGAIGADRTKISGPFLPKDELITSSSLPLLDGTVVAPANPVEPTKATNTPRKRTGINF